MRKNHYSTPVLMLTAKSEVEDRVAGLDKNMEKQDKERAEICETLKEKFGEKNPDVKV